MATSSPKSTLKAHVVCLRATPFETRASAHKARNGLYINADMYTVPAESIATPPLTNDRKHRAKVCPHPMKAYNKRSTTDERPNNRAN